MDGRDYNYNVIPIARELVSALERGVVASASAIHDYALEKNQETINAEVNTAISDAVESWNTTYTEDIKPQLESAIETANRAEEKVDDLNGAIENINTTLSSKASVASVSTLSNDVAELLASNVNVTLSANKTYVYKSYPISIILTSKINTDESNVLDYAIFKGNTRIGDAQSNIVILSRTATNISLTTEFRASANLTIKGVNTLKYSGTVTVTAVNPIYKGLQRIDDLTSLADSTSEASADVFASTKGVQVNLYSSSTPINTLVGKTVKFNLTDNYRAWVITTVSTLGATDGGFDFPFYRYSISNLHGTGYYLYVSKNVYSDGEHSLVFNSNGKY